MIDDRICLKNLRQIVTACSDDHKITSVSLDELQSTYKEIANYLFRISISNVQTFRNLLWNFENLKPEIRLGFQKQCFSQWHSTYLNLIPIDNNKDVSENDEQTPPALSEDRVENERQRIEETKPAPTIFFRNGYVYKRDWFDKLLDCVATIVYR